MPLFPLQIKPGVNKELPSLTSEPAWRDANFVRFRNGFPEKIGGWLQTPYPQMEGVPRTIHRWRDRNGLLFTAIGTNEKLYSAYQELLFDITPIRETQALVDAIDTTQDSTTVIVNDIGHGAVDGDWILITGYDDAAQGNPLVEAEVNYSEVSPALALSTQHKITYINEDKYSFEVTTPAGSNQTGIGGSISIDYQINIGAVSAVWQYGYGVGGYGLSTYGDERVFSENNLALRMWSLDNFGDYLVATHESGSLYYWEYETMGSTLQARAAIVTNAPTINEIVIVTDPDRHVVVFASTPDDTNQDYLLVRWADQESLTDWAPAAINTAGDHILNNGTRIMAAKSGQLTNLIWTDSALFSMNYVGQPYTFSFQQLAINCGAVSKECVVTINNMQLWMGESDFYIYDGRVSPIPCSLHRYVFDDINEEQLTKVIGGTNEIFNEIIWFYPSSGSLENDRYVIYNYVEQVWVNGALERTAWYELYRDLYPLACDSNGNLFYHEYGNNAHNSPMVAYIETSDFDIEQGDKFYFIRRMIHDFTIESGSVDLIFKTRRYPHSTQVTDTTLNCTASTEKLDTRIRTRQLAVRIQSDDLGDKWFSGLHRIDIRPDGKR